MGDQRDGTLIDEDGQRRAGGAQSIGGGHDRNNDQIEHRFCGEQGVIPGQSVLNGTDDGHGADTDDEGGVDKAVHKAAVILAPQQLPQAVPRLLHPPLHIDEAAQQTAQHQREDEQHGALRFQRAVGDGEHPLKRPGDADEDDRHAAGLH